MSRRCPERLAPAQRAGGQFTFEHPINNRLTVAAEWYTGNHASSKSG
ncbi:MAG TPA: hypothetical protein VFF64_24205 [Candidatus Eremiobacteraceae bacterium]|nr:hypothetical protein [Candidatus Eremiobacteraceae bacterium]